MDYGGIRCKTYLVEIATLYRPLRLRALKRELALRWILIMHRRWFDAMASSLFGAKNLMRHVLKLKDAMCNRWTSYSEKMKLSFKEASSFWVYIDDRAKGYFLRASKEDTIQKKKHRLRIQKKRTATRFLGH